MSIVGGPGGYAGPMTKNIPENYKKTTQPGQYGTNQYGNPFVINEAMDDRFQFNPYNPRGRWTQQDRSDDQMRRSEQAKAAAAASMMVVLPEPAGPSSISPCRRPSRSVNMRSCRRKYGWASSPRSVAQLLAAASEAEAGCGFDHAGYSGKRSAMMPWKMTASSLVNRLRL